ncbi:MAG: PKD domain-containing protein [bacterium]|nr:PKD domain-containing protein [bacterium]
MTSLRALTIRLTATLFGIAAVALFAGSASAQLSKADIDRLKVQAQQEGWTFTVTENEATQYSIDQLCGFKVPDVMPSDVRFDPMSAAGAAALPAAFDWRVEAGGLPPVRNQGGCGSCWAFGTVGPLECNIKIKDGLVVNLSEQYLVSCNANGYGCAGGWWEHRMHYNAPDPCNGTGAVLETDFPYVASDVACSCPHPHAYTIDGWGYIGTPYTMPSVTQLKQALMQYGPVSVAVSVNDAFQAYGGGVFNGCANGSINHAVTLVGWDDNQSGGIWIIRNSWGSNWGEGGYMRMPYNCSYIGYNATYINYRGTVWFSGNQTLAPAPADVTFTAETMLDVVSWNWTFGDGATSTVQNPTHTYTAPGCYDVTCSIQTSGGSFSTTEHECVMIHADTFSTTTAQAIAGQTVSVDVALRNFVPIAEAILPISWSGTAGIVLDSATTTGLRSAQLTLQQVHYDMTRATYKITAISPQPDIAVGTGSVLRLWFTVPSNATGGSNPITVSEYVNGTKTYSPVVTTTNGTYQPAITGGAVSICKGGDVNSDGIGPDLSDLSFMILYLTTGSPQLPYRPAANVDGAGAVDLSDLSRLITFLTASGAPLSCGQ